MPYKVTIDHAPADHSSEHSSSSSISDGEDSSGTGVQVSPSSLAGSHEYSDPETGSWVLYPDEIGPSDSASRPRTSNHHRPVVEAPRPQSARRQASRRQTTHDRGHHSHHSRTHRPPVPIPLESVDPNEEWQGFARGPTQPHGRTYAHWGHVAANPSPGYAPSYSSGQAYSPFSPTSVGTSGQQLVPFANHGAGYGFPPYPPPNGGSALGYFPHGQQSAHTMSNQVPIHGTTHYGGQDVIHHNPGTAFYHYAPQSYPMPQPMPPPAVYHPYPAVYSPSPPIVSPTPPPADNSKDDEKFARLEKILLDQKAEQDAKEAAAKKAAEDAAAKAAADKKVAEEIAAVKKAAAAAATEEAEKKAAEKAAEEAARNKAAADEAAKAAEEAAAKAAAEAATKAAEEAAAAATAAAAKVAATPPPPPPPPAEKKKPIKFKDAGMEDLIRQAFLHVEVIGPHVAEGHYDLVGPGGDIILPQVWETVIEPDWVVTMHMWPIPEPPKPEDPPPDKAAETPADKPAEVPAEVPPVPPPAPEATDGVVVVPDAKKKKSQKSSTFMTWTAGRKTKSSKTQKKPEGVAQETENPIA